MPERDVLGGAVPHDHADRPYDWVGAWSERRASLTPDRVGVRDTAADESYTYAELDERANRAARTLRSLGTRVGDRVAIVSRNRVEFVDLFFATAKIGAVLAPLSHRLPERDLAAVLTDVDPAVVLVETPFEPDLIDAIERGSVDATVRSLPTDDDHRYDPFDAEDADGATVESVATALSDPHMLLHTGGTTGVPKETVITHGSIYWNSFNTITTWGLREDDVVPVTFPMYHTGGWNVVTVPCFHMGGTVLVRPEVRPAAVLADLATESATVLTGVPSLLGRMAGHEDWPTTDLSTLRFVKSGAGDCPASVVRTWRDRGVDFSQGYGLTECGPNNFGMPTDAGPEAVDGVGVPAFHVDARVVDEDGEPVERGEVGELELAGPHAADGYRGHADASTGTFGAWVSTGDLVVVDEAGHVRVEGRETTMFVAEGENVYPSRVEAAATDHPKVDDVVVLGVPDEGAGTVGKAIVAGDDSLTLDELQGFLRSRVADYAIPRHLVVVDDLAPTATATVDRAAIEERFGADGTGQRL